MAEYRNELAYLFLYFMHHTSWKSTVKTVSTLLQERFERSYTAGKIGDSFQVLWKAGKKVHRYLW